MYSSGNLLQIKRVFITLLFCCCLSFLSTSAFSQTDSVEQVHSGTEIDAELAAMSDTQVRQRLAEEMRKDAVVPQSGTNHGQRRINFGARIAKLLQSIGTESASDNDMLSKFIGGFQALPTGYSQVLKEITPPDSSKSPVVLLIISFVILGFSLIIAQLFSNFLTRHYFTLDTKDLPTMGAPAKFISAFTRNIPYLLSILIFISTAYILYILILGAAHPPLNLFFNGLLFAIGLFLLVRFFARLFLSPSLPVFRIIPVGDKGAANIQKAINYFTFFFFLTFYLVILFRGLGVDHNVTNAIKAIGATLLTLTSIWFVIKHRKPVAEHIQNNNSDSDNTQWATEVFAKSWHILASSYFLFLWALLLYDYISSGYRSGQGAFIISFLIIPIWLLVNSLGQWVTRNVFNTLRIHDTEPHNDNSTPPTEEELFKIEEGRRVYNKARNFTRISVTLMLAIWVATLWNVNIPFLSKLTGIFFDTLLILIIALFIWRTISTWIEKKIFESTSDDEEADDDSDSEWGGAAKRGRAYTLLPMLKKFVGSVLIVMVTLTILSSFGVDIGPLLAGAGVVGLAVGFGAQKLVSDVLSGFFFLLDDAFRVGEYIEAGGLSGSVEDITLRNVMLRHHRGMLQIVPHSELGAVTNFMRGGIIVKFNLDFPYDADIDQIRKVIKKVGQAMMDDEEFGKDFIKPVKSAGVREITNSVMTIRVKFTAQPGTHFVIRREAYKRITEALAAKGIHYAHRKVIVDLPQELIEAAKDGSNETAQQTLQAAGAAALSATEQDASNNNQKE